MMCSRLGGFEQKSGRRALNGWSGRWSGALGCIVLVGWTAASARTAESVYTDTRRNCQPISQTAVGRVWRCKGPGGYSSVFSDEGNVVAVEYGPEKQEKNLGGLSWPGGDRAIGPRVEWRVSGQKPYAAILRVGVRQNGRSKQFLLIAKVSDQGSCRVALIPALRIRANARARQIADAQARAHVCAP